jgi:general secretion pathway protein G
MRTPSSEVQAVTHRPLRGVAGFTLVEVLVAIAIVGTLAALTVPRYHTQAQVVRAAKELRMLEIEIASYQGENGTLPPSLAAIGRATLKDPWGNPYRYLVVSGAALKNLRKDRFLVPINSDYDLYSTGPDGQTLAPLSSKAGRDDIVRANDGGYVGTASQY